MHLPNAHIEQAYRERTPVRVLKVAWQGPREETSHLETLVVPAAHGGAEALALAGRHRGPSTCRSPTSSCPG